MLGGVWGGGGWTVVCSFFFCISTCFRSRITIHICLVVCCDGWGSRGVAIAPSASKWLSHFPQTNGGGGWRGILRWVRPPQPLELGPFPELLSCLGRMLSFQTR